ncbi:hypothetical protein CBR_g12338 [Chara braunii]|uniref:acyl-CoA oxidase n=1 Tax=Chara braunii TaxID=69332 RepID=A0A388KRS8_CHABU|nr:hypothetical protein CBR_g12338 [Chara braunii]|eukprot:GBG72770.1 hypothetical protein CBR_g12338 [Chara braunii]
MEPDRVEDEEKTARVAAIRRLERLSAHLRDEGEGGVGGDDEVGSQAEARGEDGYGGAGDGDDSERRMGVGTIARSICVSRKQKKKILSNIKPLASYLAGDYSLDRQRVYDFFRKNPSLITPAEISKKDHRDLVLRQMLGLVKEANIRPLQYLLENPAKYFAVGEGFGVIDLSLAIKMGVQFSLWGGSVANLGTKKHRDKYLADIDALDLPGCFAMTELHHGSNVQGVQTTATFDKLTDEFIIHTPNDGAVKWWIGNAALHGKMATVFARLKLPSSSSSSMEEDMGVHAFIVPLRSMTDHSLFPGVEIRDCGYKVGLNGIDNGAIRFTKVRVPRDNMLDRFGSVSADGKYSSPLPTASKRFAATLGELVGGRVALASGSNGVLKMATTIAVRYSLLRQQFGPPNEPEIAILDYQSMQQKLMPMLASTYAFHFATADLIKRYADMKKTKDDAQVADVHVLSAGLKAYVTSYTNRAISICREACGGHGYAAVNRLGALRNDHDIFLTFEGDNTVLLQQLILVSCTLCN